MYSDILSRAVMSLALTTVVCMAAVDGGPHFAR